jgi:hypothetical protein
MNIPLQLLKTIINHVMLSLSALPCDESSYTRDAGETQKQVVSRYECCEKTNYTDSSRCNQSIDWHTSAVDIGWMQQIQFKRSITARRHAHLLPPTHTAFAAYLAFLE